MCQSSPQPSSVESASRLPDAESLPEMLDAIVIGSGFGGAVAAARLAQAGRSVLVLERGRRFRPADFPRAPRLADGWLWNLGRGMYDVRWLDRMLSIQAAGWGGGSLVYANVFARPSAEVFADPRWTVGRADLDPYYDLAAHMLDVAPVAADPTTGRVPERATTMEAVAARMGRPGGTIRPNLAVRFEEDPDAVVTNRYGVKQRGCSFCGECVIGCRRGAKNSLDQTYLALAEQHGAHARTGAEVDRVEPDGQSYRVHWKDHTTASRHHRTARMLVLAAGAIGTTELLLRQRDVLRTLPALSLRLGEGFSGNGDAPTLLRRPQHAAARRGPTITTTTVLDVEEDRAPVWFQVQDGAIPEPLTALMSGVLHDILPFPRLHPRESDRRRETIALLLMGRDSATGRLSLDRQHQATVAWDARANRRLTRAQARVGKVAHRHLGGRAYASPTWSLLRTPITVHPLGGAPRGADEHDGVIDQYGRVHGYPGMLILDGAAVPTATGANPSATILALAERGIEHAIRTTGDPDWRAPEWEDVRPVPAPEDEAGAAMARLREQSAGDGLRFSERLTGSIRVDGRIRAATLRLTADLTSWQRFQTDQRHPLAISGTFDLEGTATSQPVRGRLELFPAGERFAMRYILDARTDAGTPLRLVGTKTGPTFFTAWHRLTTLRLEIAGARNARGPVAGRGILRISTTDVVRMLGSVRGVAFTAPRRIDVVRRFTPFFALRALGPSAGRETRADAAARLRRLTGNAATDVAAITAADDELLGA
ncbi:GMC family oxidoreductase [Microbacterium trichothecenolyticum]|uniref:GMC oxidoreductase n=1 Tax=Microbacterium trichothecenolyticum TaxID=69370 RepID=UPI001C6E2657|nr:GMC family oxidoreductase [Microbacterium trichothecenolyticum]MBW9121444.1 GMC family oxidoreductase [Microbacterium trichothecenolyticum]